MGLAAIRTLWLYWWLRSLFQTHYRRYLQRFTGIAIDREFALRRQTADETEAASAATGAADEDWDYVG
jgi:hypothetical protein